MSKTFKEQRAAVRGAPMRDLGTRGRPKDLATARGKMPSRSLDSGMKVLASGLDKQAKPRHRNDGMHPAPFYAKDE